MSSRRTVVVGGGIVGAFSAWYLLRAGRDVTIVEANQFGSGCSHGNCGYISPSHVFPLPVPGKVRRALAEMVRGSSPLRIPLRWSPSLWLWLMKFARHCNERDMWHAGKARHQLLQSSMTEYGQLAESGQLDLDWHSDGLLFVFRDADTLKAFQRFVPQLHQDYGLAIRCLDGRDLHAMEPAVKPELAGALWFEGDAHIRPDRVMQSLRGSLVSQGATIQENCRVSSFASAADVATAVRTNDGREISADEFVIATGALTPFLNRELGCRIPIEPGKGYSITMKLSGTTPCYPMILKERQVGLTPFRDGFRIGSTMEFVGYNSELTSKRLQYLRDGTAEYLQQPVEGASVEEWFGWRPMTPDGLPYIDRTPRYRNVWLAAGHNMIGMSTAPATGRLISELITDQPTHVDPLPFRLR